MKFPRKKQTDANEIAQGLNPSHPDRRRFLTGIAAVGASTLVSGSWLQGQAQQAAPANSGWIDVHHHHTSPEWESMLIAKGLRPDAFKDWSPAKDVEEMDQAGVATSMTSAATYLAHRVDWGIKGGAIKDNALMARLARACNEEGAKMASDYPGRFGLFAVLPLPFDIDGSLKEIEYSFGKLNAKGVALATSYGDKWLGDPIFTPIFEELNRRKAVVYTHPVTANCCVSPSGDDLIHGLPSANLEFRVDTTRTIMSLILSGGSKRYSDCHFIFSHGGGVMPFLNGALLSRPPEPDSRLYEFRRFYYDTAGISNPLQISVVKQVVGISQMLFGTDFPYGNIPTLAKELRGCGLTPEELQAIGRDNALKFLPEVRA